MYTESNLRGSFRTSDHPSPLSSMETFVRIRQYNFSIVVCILRRHFSFFSSLPPPLSLSLSLSVKSWARRHPPRVPRCHFGLIVRICQVPYPPTVLFDILCFTCAAYCSQGIELKCRCIQGLYRDAGSGEPISPPIFASVSVMSCRSLKACSDQMPHPVIRLIPERYRHI